MYARLLFTFAVVVLVTQFAACGRKEISFAADVMPILKANCLQCHNSAIDEDTDENYMGEGAYSSGFSVADYDTIMKGTSLGTMVIPGSSISSTLYLVIAGKTDPAIRMPPHHDESWAEGRGESLGVEQLEIIAGWIDQGAKNN